MVSDFKLRQSFYFHLDRAVLKALAEGHESHTLPVLCKQGSMRKMLKDAG